MPRYNSKNKKNTQKGRGVQKKRKSKKGGVNHVSLDNYIYYFDIYNITSRLLKSIVDTNDYRYINYYISTIFICIEPTNFNKETLEKKINALISNETNAYNKITTVIDNFFKEKLSITINEDYIYKQYCYLIKDALLLKLEILCENNIYSIKNLDYFLSYIEEVIYKFSTDDFKDIFYGTSTIINKLILSQKLPENILTILNEIYEGYVLLRLKQGISILVQDTLQLKDVIGDSNTGLFSSGESTCVFGKME